MNAGADAVVAYTAERDTEAMIVEVAATRSQPVVEEIQRLRAHMNARFDAMDARLDSRFDAMESRFDAMGTRFDAVGARFDSTTAKLDKLIEDGARRDRQLATLVTQMRWLVAEFVVLVIVLVVGFGVLFTR